MGTNEIGPAQADAIRRKAQYWRSYITVLREELGTRRDFPLFRLASLWATTFAHIEWLAAFDHYKERLSKEDVSACLNRYWAWELDIGRLFWQAGRHPIAHVGHANSFYSYGRLNGVPTSVSLDITFWSEAVTAEWNKYHPRRAVMILPPLDIGEGPKQVVVFFHQMLSDELLPVLAEEVARKIEVEADAGNLSKIVKLNRMMPH